MGFTTILDILSSTIIGGIILLNLLKLNENVYKTEVTTMMDVNLQVEVVNVARILENDFNKIGYCGNPDNVNDLAKITLADSSAIKIVYDIADSAGTFDGIYDTVYYYVSDTTILNGTPNPKDRILYRQVNSEIPFMVSNNITDFKLQYLDGIYTMLSTPMIPPTSGLVTYIKISFRVEDPFAFNQEYNEAYWRRLTVTAKNLKRN